MPSPSPVDVHLSLRTFSSNRLPHRIMTYDVYLKKSVGATQVNPNSTVFEPEGACEQVIFSGGGFSNVFSIPDYQKADVASFLKNHPPPFSGAQFNNSGTSRAFPDLSANG